MLVRQLWPSRPGFEGNSNNFDQLRREVLRLFDGQSSPQAGSTSAGVFPPLNITQDENNFYLRAEVPGVKADELSITAVKNRLSIAGRREIAKEHERVSYHRRERAEGSFNRTVTLPVELDAERIEARYADGILALTLPKAEEAKPRQIVVKT
jgi:HSP20 family protein